MPGRVCFERIYYVEEFDDCSGNPPEPEERKDEGNEGIENGVSGWLVWVGSFPHDNCKRYSNKGHDNLPNQPHLNRLYYLVLIQVACESARVYVRAEGDTVFR